VKKKKRIKQKNYSFEGIKEGESYINFRRRIGKETVKKIRGSNEEKLKLKSIPEKRKLFLEDKKKKKEEVE